MISLGIDIGGTGCKCVAFRDDGKELSIAYSEYPLSAGEVNLPSDILTSSVLEVISECTSEIPDKEKVVAITVSSFGESFVAIDENGEPLTDILLYFGNTESEEFDRLIKSIGEDNFMKIARILPDASYSLSKMLYTKRVSERPVWKYLFIAGFITYKLTGRPCTDVSLACRSLLYDVENRSWSRELLSACSIDEDTLPEVLPTGGTVGFLLPEFAKKLGLSESVRVVIGAHDQIVNALGAGVENIGDAVDTSGTCECITPLFATMPQNLDFQKNNFACVPYLNEQGFVTYAYNISAGSVIRWFRDSLCESFDAEAQKEGKSIYDLLNDSCPDTPSDMLFLPFLQGMGGTPDVNASAKGTLCGLTTSTRLPDIYRAILEGITFEMRYNQEKLAENGVFFNRLFACGGGARSRIWLQIKADILGCEILPVKSEETGAMGSAILGLAAVCGENPFDVTKRFLSYGDSIIPNQKNREIYNKKYQMYKTLREFYSEQLNKER